MTKFCTHLGYNTTAPCGKDCPKSTPQEDGGGGNWRYDFDKIFVEERNHRGGRFVRAEASELESFISQEIEKADKKAREEVVRDMFKICKNTWVSRIELEDYAKSKGIEI